MTGYHTTITAPSWRLTSNGILLLIAFWGTFPLFLNLIALFRKSSSVFLRHDSLFHSFLSRMTILSKNLLLFSKYFISVSVKPRKSCFLYKCKDSKISSRKFYVSVFYSIENFLS